MKAIIITIAIALIISIGAYFVGNWQGKSSENERITLEAQKRQAMDSLKIIDLQHQRENDSLKLLDQREIIDTMGAQIARSDVIISKLLNRPTQIIKHVQSLNPLELEEEINKKLKKKGVIK